MKYLRTGIAALLCVFILPGTLLFAQPDKDEAEHEALRAIKAAYEQAVNENNLDLLKPFLDESFSVVTYTDKEFTDFAEFKAQWQKTRTRLLKGGSYSVTLLPERSQLLGDLAIAKGDSENVMVTGDGEEFKFTSRWTAICRKIDGEWKVVRGHNSLDPFGNPVLIAAAKKLTVKAGLFFGIAGLLFGLFGGWIAARKKYATAS